MDQKELLMIVGDLYLKYHMAIQEIEKKNLELQELRTIIISLQGKNGTAST